MIQRKPILRPMALAGLLAVGAGIVFTLAVMWIGLICREPRERSQVNRNIAVTDEGVPLVELREARNNDRVTYQTLDGKPVPPDKVSKGRLLSASFRGAAPDRRPDWRFRLIGLGWSRRLSESWYFLHDGRIEGAGYFVAYDLESALCKGYLGAKGFRPTEPPPEERFPVDGRLVATGSALAGRPLYHGYQAAGYAEMIEFASPGGIRAIHPNSAAFLLSGDRLLEIDLQERSVRTLTQIEHALSLNVVRGSFVTGNGKQQGTFRFEGRLGLRTPDGMVVIDPAGGQRETYPLPPPLRDLRWTWTWYQVGPGEALAVIDRSAQPLRRAEIYWLKAGRGLVRQQEVVWQSTDLWKQPGFESWLMAVGIPVPLLAPLTVPARHMGLILQSGEAASIWDAHALAMGRTWAPLLALCLVAAGLAWLVWRRQRRLGLPWTGVWVVFVFLGGVPGLIGYLVHRRWPPVANCESCGQRVPRDREACARCGTEFPAAALTGNEIFG